MPQLQGGGIRIKHVGRVLRILYSSYPDSKCSLIHSNPLELLLATILSAQCTDVRVNQVTSSLFKKHRSAKDYAATSVGALEQEIRSTGFYRNKAKSIRESCRRIVREYRGRVPSTMEELIRLPGVGRKTANVLLGTWFGKAEGVVVDTHVRRISRRLGLTREENPEKIERDLMNLVPRKDWIPFSHMLIWHGRKICTARSPKCAECPLAPDCPSSTFHVKPESGSAR